MRLWLMLLYSSSFCSVALALARHQSHPASSQLRAMTSAETASPLRILALHGSEGTADSLQRLLEGHLRHVNCEITTIQAPFRKGSGYAWWQLNPGERSFTASTYPGYAESAALVEQALQKTEFDVIFGHSQGAILLVAMLANGQLTSRHSFLNGVAWPNPFSEQLLSEDDDDWSDLNVLQIIGVQDRINPPEQALRVEEALRSRGCKTTQLHHPGGHSIPSEEKVWGIVADWLAQKELDSVHFVERESLL